MKTRMSKYSIIAAAMAILPLLASAAHAEQPTPGQLYQARYFVYGAYVRAGQVCQYQPFVSYGMSRIATPELKTIGDTFKDLTTQWATEGAQSFNGTVMNYGLVHACGYMVKIMNGGENKAADLKS